MTLFELVKQNICVPDAAEHYGLQVSRNGMCSCPFHVVATSSIIPHSAASGRARSFRCGSSPHKGL